MPHHLIGVQIGNYLVIDEIGHGAFADVLLAEHVVTKQRVAVKVLSTHQAKIGLGQYDATFPTQSDEDAKIFDNEELLGKEIKILTAVNHPNVIKVYEGGFHLGQPYLVMELMQGSVAARIRGRLLSLDEILQYAKPIAAALDHIHQTTGLVHQDVKPANILIDAHNHVVLSDFGIVRGTTSADPIIVVNDITVSIPHGTLPYMSPEQILNQPRRATDQYALGVVIYEWLSGGQYPFFGTRQAIAQQKVNGAAPLSFATVGVEVAPEIERIVMKALAFDPRGRFPTVTAFVQALEQVKSKKRGIVSPIVSKPESDVHSVATEPNTPSPVPDAHDKVTEPQPVLSEPTKMDRVKATVLNNKGRRQYENGHYHEALALFDRAIHLNPKYADAYYGKGLSLFYLKLYYREEFGEVLALFDQAIQLNPKYADAYYSKGITLYQIHKFEEALEAFTQAIALAPRESNGYYYRGNTLKELGRYQEALDDYTEAIAINPRNKGIYVVYVSRGDMLKELRRYQEALDAYDQAIVINRRYDAYLSRGDVLKELGRYQEALDDYAQAERAYNAVGPYHIYNPKVGRGLDSIIERKEEMLEKLRKSK